MSTGQEPVASLVLIEAMAEVAEAVGKSASELNRLDGVAGDGDLGVTAGRAAEVLRSLVTELSPQDAPATLRAVGMSLARTIPSTGGTLIALALVDVGKALEKATGATSAPLAIAMALEEACVSVARRGRVAVGDKTMLDALVPAAAAARRRADAGEAAGGVLRAAAQAAEAGARATADLRATVGRAGWLADRSQGHIDAGAWVVALCLGAAAGSSPNLPDGGVDKKPA